MANISGQDFPRQYSESGEEICPICCEEARAWAVGSCEHAVCLSCSARLRVLCRKKECPIYREVNDKVIVFPKPQSYVVPPNAITDRKHGFIFSKASLVKYYENQRALRCSVCKSSGSKFTNLRSLQEHTRREHGLYYCEICFEHLKLFPYEHKLYSKDDLIRHRRTGDPDDKSHKGHPQCAFCDERYFGKDELFFHLKKNHFWCHFCEQEGNQEYYPDYKTLKEHFRHAHYLCEEGPCHNEKFTNAFLSKLDFQAHRAKVHTRGLSKSEAKQLRQVEVGFTYSRPERDGMGGGGNHRRPYRQTGGHTAVVDTDQRDLEAAIDLSIAEQQRQSTSGRQEPIDDFPVLRGGGDGGNSRNKTIKSTSKPKDPPPKTIAVKQDVKKPQGLENNKKDTKKPPGLENQKQDIKKPPPGLENGKQGVKKPPGLERASPVDVSLPQQHIAVNDVDQEDEQRDEWPSLEMDSAPSNFVLGRFPRGREGPPPGLEDISRDQMKASSEFSVLEDAVELLQHNTDKVNQFKSLSGQYQRGFITVKEYNHKCRKLFGQSWREFGIRLAGTLPTVDQQNELYTILMSNNATLDTTAFGSVPPPGFTHFTPIPINTSNDTVKSTAASKKSKKKKSYRNQVSATSSGVWKQPGIPGKVNLKDSEYPSLGSSSITSVPSVPSWVSAVK